MGSLGAWRERGKIHNFEGRSALMGLRAVTRAKNVVASELVSLGDNLAEVLATELQLAAGDEEHGRHGRAAVLLRPARLDAGDDCPRALPRRPRTRKRRP